MSISTQVPIQSRAASALPHWPGARQEELQLARLEALLVNRSAYTNWWDCLAEQAHELTNSFLPHLSPVVREEELEEPPFHADQHVAPELARLEAEHIALLEELSELRSIVARSSRSREAVSGALAASTEVIAMLRGHNRRHRNVAHDADLVESGATT